ncbi:DUF4132 domain-containing protein [Nocardia jejuensis]|uniref:DUF4132 domain-containing protein n=1 Tax=Nocardia jejuensis TaxID=328049 RepID=UPI00082F00B5|nr:DUF4132 domain-containing protein [Nocardia jejuensis]
MGPTELSVREGKIFGMTDEDAWSVPADWSVKGEPFRGMNEVRSRPVDPEATAALAKFLRRYRPTMDPILATVRADGADALADAAHEYTQAPDTFDSAVGAAIVFAIARFIYTSYHPNETEQQEFADRFVDSWIACHGYAFAAEATVWQRAFAVHPRNPAGGHPTPRVVTAEPHELPGTAFDTLARRVRGQLATAPEHEYRAAVRCLSRLRTDPGGVWSRLATSYLLPEQQDWVEEDLALEGLPAQAAPLTMLVTALTTPEQLNRFLEIANPPRGGRPEQRYSLLSQVGPAAAPLIVREFAELRGGDDIRWLAGILGQLPSDEAYLALLDRLDNRHAAAASSAASERFPRRAMRLLSRRATESGSIRISRLLRIHAHEYPELVAAHADPATMALLEEPDRGPEAHPDQLPVIRPAALPARSSKPPRWLAPALLPRIRLCGTDTVLPESTVVQFITILMASGPGGDHPDVGTVADVTDPGSLAEFAWAIFDAWHCAAYPSTSGWVLNALGLLGTEDTVRRLVPFITAWSAKRGHARAVEALHAVAAIGGEAALQHLHTIARRTRAESVRAEAEQLVAEIAQARGLTEEELADRVVPDLGLARRSTLLLNYGERQFHIGVDPTLRPSVTAAGIRLATLPKPGKSDDPALAPVAYQSFRDFTQELKTVTSDQIRRFEAAMVDGRRWRASAHRELVIEHPVLGQLARRLVWATFADDGSVTGSFRVESDRSLADIDDERVDPAPHTLVGVAHPLHLGDSLAPWRELFQDYELHQPFDQLDRSLHTLTAEEAAANQLSRFVDRQVPTGKLYGLRQRGWELSHDALRRRFGRTRELSVTLDPGIQGGYRYEADKQRIAGVELRGGTFGALDAIAASELLRQLERLAA